jgi:Holliday junction resolvasome RuvABC endonuclease subunit
MMKDTMIVGVDPSSRKIAMIYDVLGSEENLKAKTFALPQSVVPALGLAYKVTRRFVKSYTDKGYRVILYIEEPVVGKGGAYATIKQSKVHGAIVAGAVAGGATVEAVNNTVWKKRVVGKGNASKVQVAQHVRKNWRNLSRLAGPDQDLIDAGCIYSYAVHQVAESHDLATDKEYI